MSLDGWVHADSSAGCGVYYKRMPAWRMKYRVHNPTGDTKWRLLPEAVGAHPLNRDGLSPKPGRVDELFTDILGHYASGEGDHDSICSEMPSDPVAALEFIMNKCKGGARAWRRQTYA